MLGFLNKLLAPRGGHGKRSQPGGQMWGQPLPPQQTNWRQQPQQPPHPYHAGQQQGIHAYQPQQMLPGRQPLPQHYGRYEERRPHGPQHIRPPFGGR
ncbi:hypothetical protein SAMN05421736_101944 [Evansella caseinilytica]|uniref:Uncharacterized protein n=1 Tax=Evansella caseinilytica TaxID=1503961 RepID=A0A1H3IVT4_9BACI|nr:hypothetical protein [Evansella caseinilytica]SDY31873.1 hypothetical protein SAMN05421736_101944 [Evansella caseinilytica]